MEAFVGWGSACFSVDYLTEWLMRLMSCSVVNTLAAKMCPGEVGDRNNVNIYFFKMKGNIMCHHFT